MPNTRSVSSKRIARGVLLALYLKYLLLPSASGFYELYHLIHLDVVYWGYALFKAAGYYFGQWPYQNLTCVILGLWVAIPWCHSWKAMRAKMRKQKMKKQKVAV